MRWIAEHLSQHPVGHTALLPCRVVECKMWLLQVVEFKWPSRISGDPTIAYYSITDYFGKNLRKEETSTAAGL